MLKSILKAQIIMHDRFIFQINIYFGSLDVTSIVESPKYDNAGLLNSLGGALSLFLGVSIIMLFEWLELIFRLLYSLMRSVTSAIM